MTTKKKSQAGTKRKAVPAAIKRASGALYERELKQVGDVAARYVSAAKGEGSAEEISSAWAEFSAMVVRVVRGGLLWTPERVLALSVVLLPVDAEMTEQERVSKAYDAARDSKRLAKLITSPVINVPPLPLVDRLAGALEVTKGEARRAAGYLDETTQPPEEGGANE
jgi:hypothetical protein